MAAIQCVLGMFFIWGAATERLTLPYPALLAAGFAFSNSNAAIDVVAVSCNVHNWPQDRGSAGAINALQVKYSRSVRAVFWMSYRTTVRRPPGVMRAPTPPPGKHVPCLSFDGAVVPF